MGGRFGKYGDTKRKARLRKFKVTGKAALSLKAQKRKIRRKKKR